MSLFNPTLYPSFSLDQLLVQPVFNRQVKSKILKIESFIVYLSPNLLIP